MKLSSRCASDQGTVNVSSRIQQQLLFM